MKIKSVVFSAALLALLPCAALAQGTNLSVPLASSDIAKALGFTPMNPASIPDCPSGALSWTKAAGIFGCVPLTVTPPPVPPTTTASLYAPWENGPSQSAAFFPIGVWWQAPDQTGKSGPYPTEAAAAKAEGINIFIGLQDGSAPWPEKFGSDAGELEAIKANGLYAIGGINTPYTQNTSADSVASVLALANAIGATSNVIGYNAGDEPDCTAGPIPMPQVPNVIKAISGFDPTRVVAFNNTAWMFTPFWESCLPQAITALQATSIASFDMYPLTNPWWAPSALWNNKAGDFLSVHNDSLWNQGVVVQGLAHFSAAGQPLWVYVEAGGDNLGFSEGNNSFTGSVTAGSSTLVNTSAWTKFTAAWLGLTVSGTGIPANATIKQIVDATHALMSSAATSANANETVVVTGGVSNSDCVASRNICVAQGNEYRPMPVEVNAEAWMSIINGANGIEYFCHDLTSSSFCLGDTSGGPPAAAAQANLTYINQGILSFAPELNAPTVGICSMDSENYMTGAITTLPSCTNGIVTLTTSIPTLPGAVLVKKLGASTYVFVQSSRRSTAGAAFTLQVTGLGSKTAKVVYDSAGHYGAATGLNQTFNLGTAASFSDTLGANGNDYQVKIYQVQ